MFVKNLTIQNFRNYEHASVNFSKHINLVAGLNGQGKTNLAEALVFASLAKSPRTHQDKELIKNNSQEAKINIKVERKFSEINIECNISKTNENSFLINYNPVKRISQVLGNLVCVYFSPQELKIVTGAPADRREFCDTDISMLSENYYNLLIRYERVLAQRNKLLKTEKDHAKIIDTISVWDEQLASVAAPIIKTRRAFIAKLLPYAKKYLSEVSSNKEDLNIEYCGVKGENKEEIKRNILRALDESLSKDMELGYTSVGPHRDDVKFELNHQDARMFSSQGQARSIVLALKLAEMKIMEQELGEKPIMIFDDVFSELDGSRQKKLYSCLEDAQAIFTGTTFKFKPKDREFVQIKVHAGSIKSIK